MTAQSVSEAAATVERCQQTSMHPPHGWEVHGEGAGPRWCLGVGCPVCPQELHCMKCHRDYPVWFAPDYLWNRVMRDRVGDETHPFVCMDCFATLANERDDGLWRWHLVAE